MGALKGRPRAIQKLVDHDALGCPVYIPYVEARAVRAYCARNGVSLVHVVRLAVAAWVKENIGDVHPEDCRCCRGGEDPPEWDD
jgi:hypothetical protein